MNFRHKKVVWLHLITAFAVLLSLSTAIQAEAPLGSIPFQRHLARDLVALKDDPLLDPNEWILTTESRDGDAGRPHIPPDIYLLVNGQFDQVQQAVKSALAGFGTFEVIAGMYKFGDARLSDRIGRDEYNDSDTHDLITSSFLWAKVQLATRPEIRQAWMADQAERARADYARRSPANTETIDQWLKDSQNCRYVDATEVAQESVAYFYATQVSEKKRYGFLQGHPGVIRTRQRLSVEIADLTSIFGHTVTGVRIDRTDTYPNPYWRAFELHFDEHSGPSPTKSDSFVPLSVFNAITDAVGKGLVSGSVIVGHPDQWAADCL